MREVKLIFEDYIISRRMLKALQNKVEESEIALSMARPMIDEKVQGGKNSRRDTKIAAILDKQNRIKIKIKRISSDLKPFVETMNKISQDEKKLLTSHYIKRENVNTIAEKLNLSSSSTRSRINKAERKFLKIYKHYLND